MANEITSRAALFIAKNGVQAANDFTVSGDLAGSAFFTNVQNIGTAAEALDFNDLATANMALFKNLDAVNYVELALDAPVAAPFAKLKPGQVALLPLKTLAIYAKANGAAVNLLVQAVEA